VTGPMTRLLSVARPEAGRLAIAALAGAAASACGIGLMATSAWLISRASQQPPVMLLTVAIVMVRGFSIFRGLLRYGERLAGHDAALRVLGLLRVRSYLGLERVAPRRHAAGDSLSRYASDVDTGLDVLVRVMLPYAATGVAGAAAVTLTAMFAPGVGLVLALGLLGVCIGVPALHQMLAHRAERHIAPLRGELAAGVVDLWRGLPELVAYNAAGPRLRRLDDVDRRLGRATARSSLSAGLTGSLIVVVTGAVVWAALTLGTAAVNHGTLDGVLLAAVVLTPLAVFETTIGLPAAAAQLGHARAALRRVFAMADAADPTPVTPPRSAVPPGPYHLRVQNVTAGWDGEPDVLRNLSLDLPPGRRVAVIGPSGSGKSTLAALLVRFLDPVSGRITLNGTPLTQLDGDDVRTVVGLMSDDAYCFDATLAANLRVARRDATPSHVRAALAAAGLLDWVDSLPLGLATPVGEHGARLSGGQRRRLALARALLADTPILILDEPTEHLDDELAAAVTDEVLKATHGRTLVLVTHRPFGLDQVDEVIRMPSRLDRSAPPPS